MTNPSLAHIAIAVPDLHKAAQKYKDIFGATVSNPFDMPEHGVSMIKVEMNGLLIELLHPLGDNSPIAKFLEKNPKGGMHHMCFRVDDIEEYTKRFQERDMDVLNGGVSRIGMEGEPVVFVHPKEMDGVLVELEQASKSSKA